MITAEIVVKMVVAMMSPVMKRIGRIQIMQPIDAGISEYFDEGAFDYAALQEYGARNNVEVCTIKPADPKRRVIYSALQLFAWICLCKQLGSCKYDLSPRKLKCLAALCRRTADSFSFIIKNAVSYCCKCKSKSNIYSEPQT